MYSFFHAQWGDPYSCCPQTATLRKHTWSQEERPVRSPGGLGIQEKQGGTGVINFSWISFAVLWQASSSPGAIPLGSSGHQLTKDEMGLEGRR